MTHKVQIDHVVRDATIHEASAIDAFRANEAAKLAAAVEAVEARESALKKLVALGLTDKEIAALIGA